MSAVYYGTSASQGVVVHGDPSVSTIIAPPLPITVHSNVERESGHKEVDSEGTTAGMGVKTVFNVKLKNKLRYSSKLTLKRPKVFAPSASQSGPPRWVLEKIWPLAKCNCLPLL